MRFTAKHAADAGHFQRSFVALLLLKLDTSLGNCSQAVQHGLLLPGVPGHQYLQLMLHQMHAFGVVPQTVFQQDKIDRCNGVTTAEEGAGLQ
ncbi:Uncharacterised protein [Yokenella regensburgei]|nr:Uncharacterised protein [Yokenella regensburgei]